MCPMDATNKPVIIFTGFWQHETDFWWVKCCSTYLLDFWLLKKKLWWFVKINSNVWVACVFILPGKAVRRVNRTVPANISTNRSSVASPRREVKRMVIGINGIQWNPSEALTPQASSSSSLGRTESSGIPAVPAVMEVATVGMEGCGRRQRQEEEEVCVFPSIL